MVRRDLVLAFGLSALCAAAAFAQPAYRDRPPGQIVQNVTAYLTGEAMNSGWHVVASRTLAGKNAGGSPAYQWYLSFYKPAADGLALAYRLPNAGAVLLAKVVKAQGAPMYFPAQDLRIVGPAELQQSGVQDVVAWSHQTGADCGEASVAVFGSNGSGSVSPQAVVKNPCDLHAEIVKSSGLSAVRLTGPYYSAKAALCCPTKPHASAMLTYANGRWSVKPAYFSLSPGTSAQR